jgi:2-keto-4-pentenoate hydratase/2-oxohepta-3-ene-1,7-dioic acid hydratase in catechol pathway
MPGSERPVVATADGVLLDLGAVAADVDADLLGRLEGVDVPNLPVLQGDPMRFGPPIARPGKVVGIGLNYATHAREAGLAPPAEPVVFLKSPTSVCGPTDDIQLLPGSVTTDYEVELGLVLGATLRRETDHDAALAAVAGYVLAHDVSDRALQLDRGGTWTKGKSADTFCPVGPWLVTPDELGDPAAVRLRLDVNGQPRQDATTADMIFGVAEILCYVSDVMTLEPGDLIITGTPAGVAMARPEPRPYLRAGDLVEADGGVLGRHRNRVIDSAGSSGWQVRGGLAGVASSPDRGKGQP